MNKINGKRKNLNNLLKNAKTEVITATEGDFYYIKVPRTATAEDVEYTLKQLQRIFPKNFVFIIPDDLEIKQLNDEELSSIGLMRIPKFKDDPKCPKCKSSNTMKNYNSLQYQKVCLEPDCGFKGGWRARSELEGDGQEKKISQP